MKKILFTMLTIAALIMTGCPDGGDSTKTDKKTAPSATLGHDATDISAVTVGDTVTFTVTPSDFVGTATYQWKVNDTDVSGETNDTFAWNTTGLSDADYVISCDVMDGTTSVTTTPADITATVNAASTSPSATLTHDAADISAVTVGDTVTFTVTPSDFVGTAAYQWKVNDTDVSGENGATFAWNTGTLSPGDYVISCDVMDGTTSVATAPATYTATVVLPTPMNVIENTNGGVNSIYRVTEVMSGGSDILAAMNSSDGLDATYFVVSAVNTGTDFSMVAMGADGTGTTYYGDLSFNNIAPANDGSISASTESIENRKSLSSKNDLNGSTIVAASDGSTIRVTFAAASVYAGDSGNTELQSITLTFCENATDATYDFKGTNDVSSATATSAEIKTALTATATSPFGNTLY